MKEPKSDNELKPCTCHPMCKYPFQKEGECRQRDHHLKTMSNDQHTPEEDPNDFVAKPVYTSEFKLQVSKPGYIAELQKENTRK